MNKDIPRNYHNVADLKAAIKQKQSRYETSSLSSVEERKLLQEIDKLKSLIPTMENMGNVEPELNKARARR